MSLTLLGLVQRAARRMPLTTVPSSVVGGSATALQFLEIAQEVGDELRAMHEWNRLQSDWTLTIGATDPHLEPFPDALDRLRDKAKFWRSDSTYVPLVGPLSPAQWQLEVQRGASTYPGFWRRYSTGAQFLGIPTGTSVTTQYVSKNWIVSATNSVPISDFAADGDTCIFSDALMILGIRAKWKQSKGLEYGQDYEDYQLKQLQDVTADTSIETIYTSQPDAYPGKTSWPGTITPVSG